MSNSSNEDQKKLVLESDEGWYEGLRAKGVSGDITEKILLNYLQEQFPKLHFFKGQIKKCHADKKGRALDGTESKLVSPQVDIIASKEEPVFEKQGFGITTLENVLFTIEVKKHTTPSSLQRITEGGDAQIMKIKEFLGEEKPIFYVGFHYYARKNPKPWQEWENLKKNSEAKNAFIFSEGPHKCPHEELDRRGKTINEFMEERTFKYKGELKRLGDTIRKLIKQE